MIELRKMTKEDVIKCGNIHYSAFYEKTNNRIINILGDEAKKLDDKIKNGLKFDFYFSQFIDDIDKYAYCIISDNQIVGYITALEIPSLSGVNTIYIDSIAVSGEFQKLGYGSEALKKFIAMFSNDAVKRLITDKNIPAYKMYDKIGFGDMDMQVMESSPLIDDLKKCKNSWKNCDKTTRRKNESNNNTYNRCIQYRFADVWISSPQAVLSPC